MFLFLLLVPLDEVVLCALVGCRVPAVDNCLVSYVLYISRHQWLLAPQARVIARIARVIARIARVAT